MTPKPFSVITSDGIDIAGLHYGETDDEVAVIFCHGFNVNQQRPPLVALATSLSRQGRAVYTFDLRGHGSSGGLSTLGNQEVGDLAAVVEHVRGRSHHGIVVVGASMGGFVALRYAGVNPAPHIDGVVAISSPAGWRKPELLRAKALGWLAATVAGRAVLRRAGTRVAIDIGHPLTPYDVAGLIAPVPVTIVHGGRDRYVPVAEAHQLYDRLQEPKKLVILDGYGHAEAGFDASFSTLLGSVIDDTLQLASQAESGWD